jgi:hypothetical protein
VDGNLPLAAAADLGGGDALELLEFLLDLLLRQTARQREVGVAEPLRRDGDAQDRILVRVVGQDQRTFRFVRERRRGDLRVEVAADLGHVGVPAELQRDVGKRAARNRGHRDEPAGGGEPFLEHLGDALVHVARTRARVLGAHRDRRIVEVGQQRDIESRVGDDAEHDGRQNEHQYGDRPACRPFERSVHSASRSSTSASSESVSWPSTTTSSVSVTPAMISIELSVS